MNRYLLGEEEARKRARVIAEDYGYGNLIAYLKREWAEKIVSDYPEISYEHAFIAADVDAYKREQKKVNNE
jgi:hypothetical protein